MSALIKLYYRIGCICAGNNKKYQQSKKLFFIGQQFLLDQQFQSRITKMSYSLNFPNVCGHFWLISGTTLFHV